MPPRSLHSTEGLGALADICWQELQRFLTPECCVMATRVFKDVMAQLGHRQVEAQAVQAYFYNELRARHVEKHHCLGMGAECQRMLVESDVAGAWMVALGPPSSDAWRQSWPDLTWHGHLVAIVERRWLVDLSVSQASHPEHGIDLGEGAFVQDLGNNSRRWLRRQGGLWGKTDTGVTVCYQASEDRSWEQSPDWGSTFDPLSLQAQITAATIARWHGQEPQYAAEVLAVRQLVGRI